MIHQFFNKKHGKKKKNNLKILLLFFLSVNLERNVHDLDPFFYSADPGSGSASKLNGS